VNFILSLYFILGEKTTMFFTGGNYEYRRQRGGESHVALF
jgi:hypothetical protein